MSADDVTSPLRAACEDRFRDHPETAHVTLHAHGFVGPDGLCKVESGKPRTEVGVHPILGGDGKSACAGDMLLEALVACAGVTLKAVATALEIPLRAGTVRAEGDLDFRGTLGVAKDAPVGFREIRLAFDLDSEAPQEKIDTLIKLTERYCVVFQTLNSPPKLDLKVRVAA